MTAQNADDQQITDKNRSKARMTDPLKQSYFSEVDIFVYDRTVVAHPLMDQLRGGVVAALVMIRGDRPTRVVDVGAGSGQITRILLAFPWIEVTALDSDSQAACFFRAHPELERVPFIQEDVMNFAPTDRFDVAVCVGVFHHIPKDQRPAFLSKMLSLADHVIVADEFLSSYGSQDERETVCRSWYDWVIGESRRRGLDELANLEISFKDHDVHARGGDTGDFKESLEHFKYDTDRAGARIISTLAYGDWAVTGGGMGVLTITR